MANDTLFICGNGLDLGHGLKTSYFDFEIYCKARQIRFYKDLTSTLRLGNSENITWSDLEYKIGMIPLEPLINVSTEHFQFASWMERKLVENETVTVPHNESSLPQIIASGYMRILLELPSQLKKYLQKNIVFDKIRKRKEISEILQSTSKTISFNYTPTLERVYNVQSKDILHIHGDIKSNTEIIIGHGNKQVYSPTTEVIEADPYLESIKKLHLLYLTKMYKKTDEIYSRHIEFFESLSGINRIIVLGHSLSEVDDYYFKKVSKKFPDAIWKIFLYSSNKDYNNNNLLIIKKFKARIGLVKDPELVNYADLDFE